MISTKSQKINLKIQMKSFTEDKNINVVINDIENTFPISSNSSTEIIINNVELLPGTNPITFIGEDYRSIDPKILYKTMDSKSILENEFRISHIVYSISFER